MRVELNLFEQRADGIRRVTLDMDLPERLGIGETVTGRIVQLVSEVVENEPPQDLDTRMGHPPQDLATRMGHPGGHYG